VQPRRAPATLALVALTATSACFSARSELSASGRGLPQPTVAFPERAAPGTVHSARLEVRNPGPGDITTLVVAFALVGAPAAEGLPTPLVGPGRKGRVLKVTPAPSSVSADGSVYRFGSLAEGETTTVTFTLRVPRRPGLAANSVTVYDDTDPSRARGVRLETLVEVEGNVRRFE